MTPIDTATNTAGTPIKAGHESSLIATTPNGKTAYVFSHQDGTVTPIDLATGHVDRTIAIGSNAGPDDLAVTPGGGQVLVVAGAIDTVIAIDHTDAITGISFAACNGVGFHVAED